MGIITPGAHYTSVAFGRCCREAGIAQSLGSICDAYDKAMAESFRSIAPVGEPGPTPAADAIPRSVSSVSPASRGGTVQPKRVPEIRMSRRDENGATPEPKELAAMRNQPQDPTEGEVRRILLVRRRLRGGPRRLGPLTHHSRSTVYAILRRHASAGWPALTERPRCRSSSTRSIGTTTSSTKSRPR